MNGGITLEPFDAPGLPLSIPDFSAPVTGGRHVAVPEAMPCAEAQAADLDAPDPEHQRENQRLEALAGIDRHLQSIDEKFQSSREHAFRQLHDRIARSVSALLPHLIESSGADEIAASTVAIVEKSRQLQPVLDVSPEEHDQIVAHLAKLASPLEVQVRKSPDTAPGTASLRWDGGGAEIDLNAFLQSARRHLDGAGLPQSTGVE